MFSTRRSLRTALVFLALMSIGSTISVAAQGAPDFTKFGYKVAKSVDVNPDQMMTITDGDQSVLIKPGTFENPVTFELLTGDTATWKDAVKDRTIRAAFAFRITDKTTKALLAGSKIPVVYSYSGKDAKADDTIFNTPPSSPPAAMPNPIPTMFVDGKVTHPFNIAVVGWLVVSAPTTGATGAAPAAASAPAAVAPTAAATATIAATVAPTTAASATTVATTAPTAAATATIAATTAPTAAATATIAATVVPTASPTRPAVTVAPTVSTTRPLATGTGGGVASTTMPVTLPQTGAPGAANPLTSLLLLGSLAGIVLIVGGLILRRTRHASR